jgi:hypothetical protein
MGFACPPTRGLWLLSQIAGESEPVPLSLAGSSSPALRLRRQVKRAAETGGEDLVELLRHTASAAESTACLHDWSPAFT